MFTEVFLVKKIVYLLYERLSIIIVDKYLINFFRGKEIMFIFVENN
jgi:hypothetical protein